MMQKWLLAVKLWRRGLWGFVCCRPSTLTPLPTLPPHPRLSYFKKGALTLTSFSWLGKSLLPPVKKSPAEVRTTGQSEFCLHHLRSLPSVFMYESKFSAVMRITDVVFICRTQILTEPERLKSPGSDPSCFTVNMQVNIKLGFWNEVKAARCLWLSLCETCRGGRCELQVMSFVTGSRSYGIIQMKRAAVLQPVWEPLWLFTPARRPPAELRAQIRRQV